MDHYTDEMLEALDNDDAKCEDTTIKSASPPTFSYDGSDAASFSDIVTRIVNHQRLFNMYYPRAVAWVRLVFTGPAGRRLEEAWATAEPKCFSEAVRSLITLFHLQSDADRARRALVTIAQSASETTSD